MSSTALLPLSLTDAPLPLPLLTRALSLSGRSASSAVMFTSPHQLSSLPPSSLGALLLLPMGSMGAGNDELVALLSSARRVLSPSALLAVVPMPNTPIAVQQSYANALLLAGFVDAEVSDNTFVVAKNPAWSAGAAVPLKRKTVATAPAPAPTNAKVTLTADDLVDEDALLLEEDRAPPPAVETETTKEGGGGGVEATRERRAQTARADERTRLPGEKFQKNLSSRKKCSTTHKRAGAEAAASVTRSGVKDARTAAARVQTWRENRSRRVSELKSPAHLPQ
eukprot:CAMPEP_0198712734 /NCGR_PEP_ID=MMETSP1471-20131121/4442_1 /TAXON_ID=41880 /ORGANISM="Pycnococcus provasolii, Strain RCC733" /LENGTH=280 /DNA_ID=CAMNT_0044472729 /DNA_START=38 /DNA_END=882 /DNA_ORIENTATION=+